MAYLLFVTIHATWAHCNFRPTIKWLEPYLVLPRFHHWHHTSQKESIDKNFAIHFPWIDRIFGTYYFPKDEWPETYGLHNEKMPAGFWGQTFYPFTRRKAASAARNPATSAARPWATSRPGRSPAPGPGPS